MEGKKEEIKLPRDTLRDEMYILVMRTRTRGNAVIGPAGKLRGNRREGKKSGNEAVGVIIRGGGGGGGGGLMKVRGKS